MMLWPVSQGISELFPQATEESPMARAAMAEVAVADELGAVLGGHPADPQVKAVSGQLIAVISPRPKPTSSVASSLVPTADQIIAGAG
jgi:hypothetical protein